MDRPAAPLLPVLLALAACAHAPREVAVDPAAEARKCDLVRTLLASPQPARLLGELAARDEAAAQVPVRVFVAKPEQGWLERLFVGEPLCAGRAFRVVQDSAAETLVLLLEPAQDGGFHFDVRRAGPEELWLAGRRQGHVAPSADGWRVGGS